MKLFILFSLLISQISFAGIFGMPAIATDFFTGDAEKLCSKYAKIDQPACRTFIVGKSFRKEFLSVCFESQKKFGHDISFECLQSIANKSAVSASRKQAEVCEALIKANSAPWVLRCVKSDVIEEFANLCNSYLEESKNNKSALTCIETLSKYTTDQIDMSHYRRGCISIKKRVDFADMANCLDRAEQNKTSLSGGEPQIKSRYSESQSQN